MQKTIKYPGCLFKNKKFFGWGVADTGQLIEPEHLLKNLKKYKEQKVSEK